MKIKCRTNLDCCKNETWPTDVPCRPMVGDQVVSKNGIWLEVYQVTFLCDLDYVGVELHIPKVYSKYSINEFEDRINRFKKSDKYPVSEKDQRWLW